MKIGIIGDTHFGAGFNLGKTDPNTQLNSRLLDFSKTFDDTIDQFAERKVQTVIITGDIFDTRHPTSAQLDIFSKCAQRAISKGMKIVVVVGNHDQLRTISTTTMDVFNSLKLSDIVVYSDIGVHCIKDENGKNVNFILMPYRDRRMLGATTNAEAVAKLQNKLQLVTKGLAGLKIVVGHFMIDKAITGQGGEIFSMSEIVVPSSIFKGFDIVVMGHVHKFEVIRRRKPLVVYSGSMEKITFGERHHTKVALVLDTNEIDNPEVIKSNIRNLYKMEFDYTGSDKYYKHQITDRIILDIERFHMKCDLKGAIVELVAKVKENDLYYINQKRIKEYILNKKVKHLSSPQISTVSLRKLRNKNITETSGGKKAMASFVNSLNESDKIKKKLLKFANSIIEAVEGK